MASALREDMNIADDNTKIIKNEKQIPQKPEVRIGASKKE
jgi:hypothetical protein